MFSTAHKILSVKLIPQTIFMNFYKIDMTFTLSCFICYMRCLIQAPHLLGYEVSLFIYIFHSFGFLTELWCAYARLFYTLQVSLCLVSRSGGAGIPLWHTIKV